MSAPELIRIVSRDSPMALAQVERVRSELAALRPHIRTEVVPVKTTGDKWMGDLAQVEGKGAFTKEVDAALLAGQADLAVYCVKDVPATGRPKGIEAVSGARDCGRGGDATRMSTRWTGLLEAGAFTDGHGQRTTAVLAVLRDGKEDSERAVIATA
ncbi:hypothetical protein [Streptomyces albiflavescens]|nr:hypothetical protein [Streptomyces albiflavescens]